MTTFEIACFTNENFSKHYELVIGKSNSDGSNYYLLSIIRDISREDLEKFSSFLNKYLENN